MKRLGLWLVVLIAALVIGCDKGSTAPKSPEVAASAAKAALQDLATHGQMGSGMQPVTIYIGSVKQSDPTKGAELDKAYQELGKLIGQPAALKAKAKELADKL